MAKTIGFDIGYASIGWCVIEAEKAGDTPRFVGTGVVTFPTDDCLASKRRGLRRTRRHIRSTRHRIERMKRWLVHRGVISRELGDSPGDAAPYLLAAEGLSGKTLTASELWSVLRWYAHNRGYDGNSRWSRDEADPDDTEKEKNAIALMSSEPATTTMAETICKVLGLHAGNPGKRSSEKPYKTLNAAFPRSVVFAEVKDLLRQHLDQVSGLDAKTIRYLLTDNPLSDADRAELQKAGIRLPKRYHGGLLFGQLVPRFDNRIISRCPITWLEEFDRAKSEGLSDEQAEKRAGKFAKVPAAKCPEFLEYRFARVLANLKADGDPLSSDLRRDLFALAKQQGRLTVTELRKAIEAKLGKTETNLEAYFTIHPDSEKQLVIDPAAALPHTNRSLKAIWSLLGEDVQKIALRALRDGKAIRLAQLLELSVRKGTTSPLEAALRAFYEKLPKKESKGLTFDAFLLRPISADYGSGRAPYSRSVLKRVVAEVLDGYDPTKPAQTPEKPDGEVKASDGVLYAAMDPSSRVREQLARRPLDSLTNNHLVRHRLLILGRLLDDLASEFEFNPAEKVQIVVEVARDLKEFSGMTAKEITAELNSRLKNFKDAVAHLQEHAPNLLANSAGRGGLIRKCRIAMDLGWRCPFTGETYDPQDLPRMEREHIIPYATRNTNALHALVLTWPEVNRMKGKRTAKQFIEESANLAWREVPGSNGRLTLFTPNQYQAFVDGLDAKGHPDDACRKRARKALLDTLDFEDKDLGFTEGQLTQSSQLMKLAMGEIRRRRPDAVVDPLPGPVTAELRKSWKLTGTLSLACPEVLDPEGRVRPKDEIRGLTHLHHALDAATLALAAHFLPLRSRGKDQKGLIWQALLKRNQSPEEKQFLLGLGCCVEVPKNGKSSGTVVQLRDLDPGLKNALRSSLAESRVMQHVPSDRSGAKVKLTTWGVQKVENGCAKLRQKGFVGDSGKPNLNPNKSRHRILKEANPNAKGEDKHWVRLEKLLGPQPKNGHGKLGDIKGAIIIEENYGLALDPKPTVIPFHDVPARLAQLARENGGEKVRVLRNGMLIRLQRSPARSKQDYSGVWRVTSIKNNKGTILIDIIRPGYVSTQNGVIWSGMNKTLGPLMECGLKILPGNYAGHPQWD